MESATRVQVLDKCVRVSLHANNLRKGKNPSRLSGDMSKY